MPPELANDAELQSRFDAIQDRFDATYIDNEIEFANKGFGSDEAESQFYRDLNEAVDELEAKCAGIYTVERRYGSYYLLGDIGLWSSEANFQRLFY